MFSTPRSFSIFLLIDSVRIRCVGIGASGLFSGTRGVATPYLEITMPSLHCTSLRFIRSNHYYITPNQAIAHLSNQTHVHDPSEYDSIPHAEHKRQSGNS
jgi:hypothetical protein